MEERTAAPAALAAIWEARAMTGAPAAVRAAVEGAGKVEDPAEEVMVAVAMVEEEPAVARVGVATEVVVASAKVVVAVASVMAAEERVDTG